MSKHIPNHFTRVVIGLLLSATIFFMKRLVDQLDHIDSLVAIDREKIAVIEQNIDNIKRCLFKHYGEKIPKSYRSRTY